MEFEGIIMTEKTRTITMGEEDYAIVFKEDGTIVPYVPEHAVYVTIGEYHFGMVLQLFTDLPLCIEMQQYLASEVKKILILQGAYGTETDD